MVAAAGAGPDPIPQLELNNKNLADAIGFCLTKEASENAQVLARKMRAEDGVRTAVDLFHASLPVENMRCDLLRDKAAAWVYKKSKPPIKLSKLAAEILVGNMKITWNQINRYVSPWQEKVASYNLCEQVRPAKNSNRVGTMGPGDCHDIITGQHV